MTWGVGEQAPPLPPQSRLAPRPKPEHDPKTKSQSKQMSQSLLTFPKRLRYYWVGSTITADGDCSHEIKRPLLLGRKVMKNLDSILKSRDITLPTNVRLIKAIVFPVVMYGCESWTIKKAEHRRIGAFELWCWGRLLRVPWAARRSNESILKEISPEYSLEGLTLKLKLQSFCHLMWRTDSLEKPWCSERLRAGG